MHNISSNFQLTKVQNATAAGSTDVTSDSVDMLNYDTVMFHLTFGTITSGAVTSIHVEQSANDSSFADLTGTNVTVADDDDNQVFWVEVTNPGDRYLRLIVDRATQNAVVGEIYALRGRGGEEAVDNNVTDTITGELHVSPAEGTI